MADKPCADAVTEVKTRVYEYVFIGHRKGVMGIIDLCKLDLRAVMFFAADVRLSFRRDMASYDFLVEFSVYKIRTPSC